MDPERRAEGEIPLPAPGVKGYAELRAKSAGNREALAGLDDTERAERRNRIAQPGQLVVHYTTAATAFGHILPTGELRLSAFDLMRDPLENKDWVRMSSHTAIPGHPVDYVAATSAANRARQRATKLLCLTGEPTRRHPNEDFDRAYARPRMWEQYGEQHQGACLVFDRVQLHRNLLAKLEGLGHCWHRDVTYDNDALAEMLPSQYLNINALITTGSLEEGIFAHLGQHHERLLFTKMEDYSDEQEARYVVFDDNDEPYIYVPFGDALIAVVVGEKFPNWAIPAAQSSCTEAHVALRRLSFEAVRPLALPIR